MVPGVSCVDRGNWVQESDSLFEARRSSKNVLARIAPYVHLIYKDVDRCRKGSVHELYCLKATQLSKVHPRNVLVR